MTRKNQTRIPTDVECKVVEDGAHAKRKGEPHTANPHEPDSDEWYSWAAGWRRPEMYIGPER